MIGFFAQAQNGLEQLIVEKYYVANAADAAGSVGTLPVGSVTYRIYADMLPGYKFQMAYGSSTHTLKFTSSTSFFNNGDYGYYTPNYSKTNAQNNTVMLDSWLSVGAACNGNMGVLKSEDDGVATVVNANGLLQNTDPSIGIPLTVQDGLIAGSPQSVQFVGITEPELAIFNATSQVGNSFIVTNGAWSALSGAVGPTAANKVLIAQITTDGAFHYELNIQVKSPAGNIEKYVTSNPVAGEITILSLIGTYGGADPASFAVTGGGSYCQGSGGTLVGLANSQVGVNYTLVKNGVPTSTVVAGTGSAISFGNQLAGTYTATAYPNGSVQTINTVVIPMTGSAVNTEVLKVTPTFTALGPYCQGSTPGVLPLTSLNGISGTWTPAVINTSASAIYTFTPTAGLCANTTAMSVIVNPLVTPTFTVLGPYCQGTTPGTLSLTSLNGITGTWSPAAINTSSAGTSSYTFTPTAGLCANTSIMNVVVDARVTPSFTQLGPYTVGATPDVLPFSSLNSIKGTWSPAAISTVAPGTTIYTFTPDVNECATTTTMSVTVIAVPNKTLNLTSVFLQGLYAGNGTMNTAALHVAPFGPGVADLITVELHNANYSLAASFPDILLSKTGTATVSVPTAFAGSYYITIKHRNSIETTTASTVSFAGSTINQAFTVGNVFGGNLGLMDGPGTFYAIYAGDVNQDGTVDSGDFTPVDNDASNYMSGYLTTDVNGDGGIDTGDFTSVDNNGLNYISTSHP